MVRKKLTPICDQAPGAHYLRIQDCMHEHPENNASITKFIKLRGLKKQTVILLLLLSKI